MSDLISDGGMDPRYEYEKERRTDKDKRILDLEAEIERLRSFIKRQRIVGSQPGSWTTLTDKQIDAAMEVVR